jgi:hypothetical protein
MKMLSDRLKDTKITIEMLFMALQQHRAKIYESKIIVCETTKIMNFIYKRFKIRIQTELDYQAPEGLWETINNLGSEVFDSSTM